MKPSTVIIGIILFAIVTMIIYGWGIVKQKNQTKDLMNLLFSKGQDKIKKYLKQNEYITISQVEQICDIEYMLKTNQIEKEGSRYKWHKK